MKTKLILASILFLSLASSAQLIDPTKDDSGAPCDILGQELILNGEFSAGTANFVSDFTFVSGCAPGGLQGNGTVGKFYVAGTLPCPGITQHGGNAGKVLHFPDIDGANSTLRFWEQGSIAITAGKKYKLSFWVYEPTGNCNFQAVGTNFDVIINGTSIVNANVTGCGAWKNKTYTWFSQSNGFATITIKNGNAGNYNNGPHGMDLLLDDISFKECLPPAPCKNVGPELILNGDFSLGNSLFNSSYNYVPGCAAGGILGNGTNNNYDLVKVNTCYSILDHNGLDGEVLHFPDILGSAGGWNFWESLSVAVTPNKTYNLSFWVYEP
jgi:hypothetical protein